MICGASISNTMTTMAKVINKIDLPAKTSRRSIFLKNQKDPPMTRAQ
jgi:hypothetical protein